MDELSFANGLETGQAYCADLLPMMKRRAEALLEKSRARADTAGVPAETALREGYCGTVPELTVEMAVWWGAGLIVVGTHGRRGAKPTTSAEQALAPPEQPCVQAGTSVSSA